MINSQNVPEVSVLTTCYNRAPYIEQTIESVLSQTSQNFEYIIVDDCSTDGSYEIAKSFAEKDRRIQVHQNEKNLGDYPNRNRAASYARGRYLKFIDSDDILYPHALEVCVHYMDRYPTAALGLTRIHSKERPLPELLEPEESFRKNFFEQGIFGNAPGSVVIRREAFETLGAFSGKRLIGDMELWFKIASHCPVLLIPGFINWSRTHADQQSACDDVFYAALRYDVAMNALAGDTCPFDSRQQLLAADQLRYQSAIFSLQVALKRLSPLKAAQYAKKTECNIKHLFKAACAMTPGIKSLVKKSACSF